MLWLIGGSVLVGGYALLVKFAPACPCGCNK